MQLSFTAPERECVTEVKEMQMEIREFSKSDWLGFAGCSHWSDGREPLIGIGVLDSGKEYALVLDPTGCCVVVEDHPASISGGWTLPLPFPTQDAARAFGAGIPAPHGIDDFLRLGFVEA